MVIEELLPRYDVTLVELVVVDPDPRTAWDALYDLDLLDVHTPLLDVAFWARGLPERAARRVSGRPPLPPPTAMRFAEAGDGGDEMPWVILGVRPGREIAFGAIGRFWQPVMSWEPVTADAFAAFDRPGWGKIAANFTVLPYGRDRAILTYEARTATTDQEARRRFGRYWTLVRPFVGHILRAVLHTAKHEAERRSRA
jgi:hypothetical protein